MAHQLPDPGASSTLTPSTPIARDSRRVTCFFSRSRDPHWNGNGFWVYPVLQDLAFTAEPSPLLLVDIMPPTEFTPRDSPNTETLLQSERRGMKAHPHVGYDTVTWVIQGQVEFQDCLVPITRHNNIDHPATVTSLTSVHKEHSRSHSRTDKVLLNPGDISWTSGPVWHAERHGPDFESGTMELIQLWINTPSTYHQESFTADGRSSHQVFSSQDLPTVPIYACSASETPTNHPCQELLQDKKEQSNCSRLMGHAQILAGTYHINNENHSSINHTLEVVHGPAQTASPIQLWNFEFFVRTTRRRTTRTSIGDDDDDDDDDTCSGSPDRIANTPNADSQKMNPSSTINNTPRDDEALSPSALPSGDDDLPTNAPYFSFPPTDNKVQWIELLYPSDQVAMILVRRGRIALLRSDDVQIIAPGGGSADEQGLKQHAASSSMDSSSTRIIQVGPQEMAVLDPLSSSYDLEETNAPASSVDQPPNTNVSDNPSTQPVSSQSASSSSSLDTIRIGIFEEEETSFALVGGRALVNQPVVGQGPFLLSCWQDLSRALTDFQQRTGIFARRPS